MPAEQIWYVPDIPAICSCAVVPLLMPMMPPVAFFGTYSGSVITVGPAARFARRTCAQNWRLSSVSVVEFHAPLMTPLPLPFWQGAAQFAPRCVTAALSSPGSALNLSW